MRGGLQHFAWAVFFGFAMMGCTAPRPSAGDAPQHRPSWSVSNVRVQTDDTGGGIDASGRRLSMSHDGTQLVLEGAVTLRFRMTQGLAITGDALTVDLAAGTARLGGPVAASFPVTISGEE